MKHYEAAQVTQDIHADARRRTTIGPPVPPRADAADSVGDGARRVGVAGAVRRTRTTHRPAIGISASTEDAIRTDLTRRTGSGVDGLRPDRTTDRRRVAHRLGYGVQPPEPYRSAVGLQWPRSPDRLRAGRVAVLRTSVSTTGTATRVKVRHGGDVLLYLCQRPLRRATLTSAETGTHAVQRSRALTIEG
jgi:hypothetical protein